MEASTDLDRYLADPAVKKRLVKLKFRAGVGSLLTQTRVCESVRRPNNP